MVAENKYKKTEIKQMQNTAKQMNQQNI